MSAYGSFSLYKKSVFYKIVRILYPYKNALWALRPAKPLGVLSRHPCRNPKPLPRGEGLCMLCWLCIVQSLWAYTPGIHAGAECGAAALTPLGATPQTPFSKIYRFFDRLSGTFSVYRFLGEGCGFYTGCDLNYLSNIHLLKAAIIF